LFIAVMVFLTAQPAKAKKAHNASVILDSGRDVWTLLKETLI